MYTVHIRMHEGEAAFELSGPAHELNCIGGFKVVSGDGCRLAAEHKSGSASSLCSSIILIDANFVSRVTHSVWE